MAEPMSDDDLATMLDRLIRDCKNYRDDTLMPARLKAQEYYDGTMKDTPSDDNRSAVVSRDVRAAIKKVMPSIVRTILGNDKVVEYEPVAEGDEDSSEQATIYVNNVVLPESGGYDAIKDAIHDALLLRNGILTWYHEAKTKVCESEHSGLDDMAFAQLVNDDYVEVLEHSERPEEVMVPGPDGTFEPTPTTVHDVRIRRREVYRCNRIASVPMEEFLIHPDALSIEEAQCVGRNMTMTRSDLIAMGYDRAFVEGLPAISANDNDEEEFARRGVEDIENEASPAMDEIDYHEIYVRVDYDNDGIAELRRICLAGGCKAKNILANDIVEEAPFADVVCERRPHQWEGQSLCDDILDIQRIKTVLHRNTLDNLYWQNNLQPIVQEGQVLNPESVLQRNFGEPIRVKSGTPTNEAVGYSTVPFVANESFQMLAYMDDVLTDRTGISDAASGLAPDALQNMTAKATALIEQAGIGQIEMIVRTMANGGIKRMFLGLLKLIIRHQDKPRTVRLSDKWVEFDPRSWNAGMDATVNTGLGAGTRERDMLVMQQVIGLQKELLTAFGPDNPFVKPDNLYNSISKMTEAAGLKSVDLYFTKPDPQEIQAKLSQPKPDPEMMKAQAQMAVEKFKAGIDMQMTDKKMQADAAKEKAQMEADLQVKLAELQKDGELQAQQIAAARQKEQEELAFKREELATKVMLEREKMDREDARAEKQRESDIQKVEAMSIGKALENNERQAA